MEREAEKWKLSAEEAGERDALLQKTLHLRSLETTDADQTALRVVRQELVDWLFRFPEDAPVMGCLEWLDTSLEVIAQRRQTVEGSL